MHISQNIAKKTCRKKIDKIAGEGNWAEWGQARLCNDMRHLFVIGEGCVRKSQYILYSLHMCIFIFK